jgi:hypothetical protein
LPFFKLWRDLRDRRWLAFHQNGLAYYAPGAGLVSFHDQSLALNTFSLLQLPAAGKLPKDIQFLNPPGNCNGQQLWQSTAGASNVDVRTLAEYRE